MVVKGAERLEGKVCAMVLPEGLDSDRLVEQLRSSAAQSFQIWPHIM